MSIPAREELYDLYWKQKMSLREIAERYGVSIGTVRRWFNRYNIPKRTVAEAVRLRNNVPEISRDELYDLYINKNMSISEIAKLYGVNYITIRNKLYEFKILSKKNFDSSEYGQLREELYDLYWNQKLSLNDIAKMYGVTRTTIRRWFKEYGIPIRTSIETRKAKGFVWDISKEELYDLYWNQRMSMIEIARKYGVSYSIVYDRFKKFGIPIRDASSRGELAMEKRRWNISKEELYDLYWNKKMSAKDIAKMYGVDRSTVLAALRRYEIPVRDVYKGLLVKFGNDYDVEEDEFLVGLIDGILIGDGSMGGGATSNACRFLSVTQIVNHKCWLEWIKKKLEGYGIGVRLKKVKDERFEKILGNEYHMKETWYLWTDAHKYFDKYYKRWYDGGKKKVPKDIKLSPVMLANWVMGDGSLNYNKKNGTYMLSLHVEGFSKEDVEFLKEKLNENGFRFRIYMNSEKKPFLLLCRQCDVYRFARMIEPYIVSCFRYKVRCLDDDDWLSKWERRCLNVK